MWDVLFVILGMIPCGLSIIWAFEIYANKDVEDYLTTYMALGILPLFFFGVSLIGNLRYFVAHTAFNVPLVIFCGACLVISLICFVFYKIRTK